MAKASRGGDESRHERPRGASVETLLLTDFGFSFDGKLHNHLLGISADKDKWRSGLLAQIWILGNTDTHTHTKHSQTDCRGCEKSLAVRSREICYLRDGLYLGCSSSD